MSPLENMTFINYHYSEEWYPLTNIEWAGERERKNWPYSNYDISNTIKKISTIQIQ